MIYVASPYSHPNPAVMEFRYNRVCDFIDKRMAKGEVVFSPIVYCHPIAKRLKVPTTAQHWGQFNYEMFLCARKMYLLKLPGFTESVGVKMEVAWARELGMPVVCWDEDFHKCG